MIKKTNEKSSKVIKILICIVFILIVSFNSKVNAADEETNAVTEDVSNSYDLNGYVSSLNSYLENSEVEGLDIKSITDDLINNKGFEYKTLVSKFLGIFANELLITLRGAIIIYIIIILMGIIKSIELEKGSDITKIAHLVCFLTLSTVTIGTFLEVISMFKDIVGTLTTLMQIISPFLMAILIATRSYNKYWNNTTITFIYI